MSRPKSTEGRESLSALPDDYFIIGLREMQDFYPDEESKRAIALMIRVLASFLDEHGLTKRRVLEPTKAMSARFRLLKRDLTEEGLEFYRLAEQKWLRGHDNGKRAFTDTRILVNTLKFLRSRKNTV